MAGKKKPAPKGKKIELKGGKLGKAVTGGMMKLRSGCGCSGMSQDPVG